ncbi:unnamed protein product [Agarophyton chilense]
MNEPKFSSFAVMKSTASRRSTLQKLPLCSLLSAIATAEHGKSPFHRSRYLRLPVLALLLSILVRYCCQNQKHTDPRAGYGMGVLAELGRLAIGAWSPGGVGGGYIASGSYAGVVDTTFNGNSSLELIAVDIVNEKLSVATEVHVQEKFTSIDWSIPSRSCPAGLIGGGLNDGTVRVWDAAKLIRSKSSDNDSKAVLFGGLSTTKKHSGPVRGLAFNPFHPTRLASGSADGTVLFWDLSNPSAGASVRHPAGQPPAGAAAPKEEVTAVLWNRKVQHILASATSSGVVNVWDLNQSRQVISIRNPRGRLRCSSLAWHPEIATQIVMTCDQDDSTGALLWDLRHPSQPIMTFTHHSSHGIASSSWCTHDSDLLLTSSRDSRTVVVSVSTGEIVSEAPQTANWNFDVKWSSRIPGLYLSSSYDGRITVNSMMTSTTAPSVSSETASALAESFGEAAGGFQAAVPDRSPRASATQRVAYNFAKPPKWFIKPVSVSMAFGGSQVFLSSKDKVGTVTIDSYKESTPLPREECDQLDGILMDLTSDDPTPARQWCERASSVAESPKDKMGWDALSLMFQTDSRRKLISYLGFDLPPMDAGDDITSHVYGLMQSPPLSVPVRPIPSEGTEYQQDKVVDHAEDIATITNGASGMTLTGPAPWEVSESPVDNVNMKSSILDGDDTMTDNEAHSLKANGDTKGKQKANGDHKSFAGNSKEQMDVLIKRAVIVGDFKTAVDACLHVGRPADALVIAHAGGPELWLQTQAEYLSRTSLSAGSKIVGAVAGSKAKMDEYIKEAAEEGKDAWKEALAVLLTYSPAEELSEACTALGQRLFAKKHNGPALFCFICGSNTKMATTAWMRDPIPKSKFVSMMMTYRTKRLMLLVQKVRLLTASVILAQGERDIGPVRSLDEASGSVLCEYGALLAMQGDYSSAVTYLSSIDPGYSCIYGTVEDLHSKASECMAVEDSMSMLSQPASDPYAQHYEAPGSAYGSQFSATSTPYMQQPPTMYAGTQMQPQSTWNSRPPLPSAVAPPPMAGTGGLTGQSFSSPPPPAAPVPGALRPQGIYTTQSTSGERSTFDPSMAYSEAPAYNPNSYQMNPPPPATGSPLPPDTMSSQLAPTAQYMQPMAPAPPPVPMPPMPGVAPVPQPLGHGLATPPVLGANPVTDPASALPPPPPPPPPVADGNTPPPSSYHSNAIRGSGQSLPPSAEVAVSETRRSKPLSSSGTPAGPPQRSGSTSSSLSALGIGTVLLEKADVSKIPPTQQVIVKSLRGSYMYARSLSEVPRYKKKMDDVSKKLGRLLAALNNGLIDAPVVELLVVLSRAVEKGNYDEASVVVSTLTKKHWDSNSQWIQGLKRLIECVLTGR